MMPFVTVSPLEAIRLLPGLLALMVSIWTAQPRVGSAHSANVRYFARPTERAVEERGEHARWIPLIAGLLVAGSIAWLHHPVPPPDSLVWSSLFGAATQDVLFVYLGGVVAHWLCSAITIRRMELPLRFLALPGAAAMAWMAPVSLFLAQHSWWASFSMFVVFLSAATAIYSSRSKANSEYEKRLRPPPGELGILAAPEPQPTARQWAPAICVGLCLNALLVACLTHLSITTALLSGISAGVIGWRWSTMRVRDNGRARSDFGSILWLSLYAVTAIAFTAGGLTRHLTMGSAIGARSRQNLLAAEPSPSYRGVILFEEKRRKDMFVPPVLRRNPLAQARSDLHPLSIPFDGVYSFFQPPEQQPGAGSLRERGSPEKLSFRSNDERALIMEARQNFGRLIDISCCSEVQTTITNGELQSRVVTLELSLANTTARERPSLSLGAIRVATEQASLLQHANDRIETLTYKIPPSPEIRQFDEAVILFHRSDLMASKSARIAIDQFVFVPRRY
jgi:hypothetical protein